MSVAYIVTNSKLVGQVADDDPALHDPSIEYLVSEIHVGGFDFDEWFQSLPAGTTVAKRTGYYNFAEDEDGDFLLEGEEGYFEPYFEPRSNEVMVR